MATMAQLHQNSWYIHIVSCDDEHYRENVFKLVYADIRKGSPVYFRLLDALFSSSNGNLSGLLLYSYLTSHPSESGSKLMQGMPEECREFCLRAVSVLADMCDQVRRGNITLWDLRNITKAKEQMKQLCQAASKNGAQKEQLSFKSVEAALVSRMEEYRVFAEHQQHLSHLCNHIPSHVQGLLFSSS